MRRRMQWVMIRPTGDYTVFEQPPEILARFLWVPDAAHPLGGTEQPTRLRRRVNLRKDELPSWIRGRPLYEYVRQA